MNNKKKLVTAGLVLALLTLGLFYFVGTKEIITERDLRMQKASVPQAPERQSLTIGDTKVYITEATTTAQITKGLSGRSSLPSDEGMLFIFASAQKYRFWMPDMQFPLDIIWIDSDKRVVAIHKNVPPLPDVTKPIFYSPSTPARFVLEVPAGFSDANHIEKGTQVQF